MMTRDPLIRDFPGRGASHLSGVIAELRSRGEKASLRMRISDLLAASGTNNPSLRKPIHSDVAPSLDWEIVPGALIFFI
jgi:hypothetical protein